MEISFSYSWSFASTGAQISTYFDKRQSLKSRIHETKDIFVDFNVR